MKALSVKQPYAQAIIAGLKDVENRTWAPRELGRIYIHSSKIPATNYDPIQFSSMDLNSLACGYIIGSVDIIDVVTDYKSPWAIPGNYHWILENPMPLKHPIPHKGKLHLWQITICPSLLSEMTPHFHSPQHQQLCLPHLQS
jgi:hypothetical protein